MIRNETFVYWNRNTKTMYFTNELGYTGLIYEIPKIRKQPSKNFMVEKLKQIKYFATSKNYNIYYTYLKYYLRGADSEFVENTLKKLVSESGKINTDKNLLWWRIKL